MDDPLSPLATLSSQQDLVDDTSEAAGVQEKGSASEAGGGAAGAGSTTVLSSSQPAAPEADNFPLEVAEDLLSYATEDAMDAMAEAAKPSMELRERARREALTECGAWAREEVLKLCGGLGNDALWTRGAEEKLVAHLLRAEALLGAPPALGRYVNLAALASGKLGYFPAEPGGQDSYFLSLDEMLDSFRVEVQGLLETRFVCNNKDAKQYVQASVGNWIKQGAGSHERCEGKGAVSYTTNEVFFLKSVPCAPVCARASHALGRVISTHVLSLTFAPVRHSASSSARCCVHKRVDQSRSSCPPPDRKRSAHVSRLTRVWNTDRCDPLQVLRLQRCGYDCEGTRRARHGPSGANGLSAGDHWEASGRCRAELG